LDNIDGQSFFLTLWIIEVRNNDCPSTSAPIDVLSQYLLHEEKEFTVDKNVPSCMFSYNCCQEVAEDGPNAPRKILEKKGGKSRRGFKTKVWAPTRSATREMQIALRILLLLFRL